MTKWIRTKTTMPSNNERVLAKYEGVYDSRIVTFWRDGGGFPHFGLPTEADGKGSQPATHWAKLSANTAVSGAPLGASDLTA